MEKGAHDIIPGCSIATDGRRQGKIARTEHGRPVIDNAVSNIAQPGPVYLVLDEGKKQNTKNMFRH